LLFQRILALRLDLSTFTSAALIVIASILLIAADSHDRAAL
jgi:hypothetical protein